MRRDRMSTGMIAVVWRLEEQILQNGNGWDDEEWNSIYSTSYLLRVAKFVPGHMTRLHNNEYTEASQPYSETTASYIFTDVGAIIGPLPPYAVNLLLM